MIQENKFSNDILVQAHSLGMVFNNGTIALKDVNLHVKQGEFVSLVGASGCGKSTLLRLISGLEIPTTGQLTIAGEQREKQDHYKIAFVFQDANLLPWRTVVDNVCLPLEILGKVTPSKSQLALEALRIVGLEEFSNVYPKQLSGGMKMRASLARALVTNPHLMLMDEPFGALDEIMRQRLGEELLEIWSAKNSTCLFVTHSVFEAIFLSSRLLIMSSRPGTIITELAIPFPYPRDPEIRTTTEFAALASKVSKILREQAYET